MDGKIAREQYRQSRGWIDVNHEMIVERKKISKRPPKRLFCKDADLILVRRCRQPSDKSSYPATTLCRAMSGIEFDWLLAALGRVEWVLIQSQQ